MLFEFKIYITLFSDKLIVDLYACVTVILFGSQCFYEFLKILSLDLYRYYVQIVRTNTFFGWGIRNLVCD